MSNSDTTKQSLFDEFPPVSTEEWEEVIKQDLKGADYKEKLRWETGEGVEPLPFYRREDISDLDRTAPIPKSYSRTGANSWEIREPIYEDNIPQANKAARNALDRGANALQFQINIRRTEGMLGGDIQGLPIQNQSDFTTLLDKISLENTPLHFDAGIASPSLLSMLWNEVRTQNIDPKKVRATFSYDPFVYLLQHGQYSKKRKEVERDIFHIAQFSAEHMPAIRPLGVNARFFHNSGATIAQELGYAIASASEYLAILSDSEINLDDAVQSLSVSLSIGSNYFLEISKFRAARLLWKNLIEAYGVDPEENPAYLHGETSRWNKTLYDPYTNMLRTSTEGMSGAIAGCDSLTVLPFDEHFRQPDEFSQRIARNQQLILSEEAYFNKVEDPAAGSYYIETLTEEIAEKAWENFQDIETEGGLFTAIENGTVQSAIQQSQEQRNQSIAKRGRTFVGTNQYTNADENRSDDIGGTQQTRALRESEDISIESDSENLVEYLGDAFSQQANIADIINKLFDLGRQQYRTVAPYRGPQAFEELRLATENHQSTPKVLNLPLGNKKWRKGRATFSSNFFGCAGYDIEDPIGFGDVDEAIDAIKKEQPDIAVICSSDKEYKELVPAIADAVSNLDDPPILVLAGYPEEDIKKYKEAGIDEFIYSKCNVIETLTRFQQKLGIILNEK
ncbi:methylmalonyl-CoA mutase small subunit [Aliifodinibius salipaludis]|uniref:methylmalonyl-CoA mutase n=1 Tax=Fodinibius salipaludis TaxID=2032627 RepID=A0A2A2GDQ6_9BACT|nr:methylmalonyl-CoA mutase family protein [Aliifodinibius salipaludis]PAU95124.1 methylmalonyl-CoA mutase small subunit [Aliifodinibius salipaludis]